MQPLRRDRGQLVQRGPQRLTHALQPVQRAHGREYVGAVRALAPARLDQALLLQALQQSIEQEKPSVACDQAGAELAQHRVVEARVGQCQAQRIFPVDPAPHGVGRLAVGEVLHELQHHSQREPARCRRRLTVAGEQRRKLAVPIHRTKRVSDTQAKRTFR